jgi:hypothetical protein
MISRIATLVAVVALSACKDGHAGATATADPSVAPPAALPSTTTLAPPASTAPIATPAPTVVAKAPLQPSATTATATTSVASGAPDAAPVASTAATVVPSPPARPVAARSTGDHWVADVSAPGDCQASTDCVATLRVQATGDYHVNREFPHKFVGTANAGVTFPGGNRFTAFTFQGDKAGVLPVRFQGAAPGTATLAGAFRTCVCIGETACEPVDVPISLAVPMR